MECINCIDREVVELNLNKDNIRRCNELSHFEAGNCIAKDAKIAFESFDCNFNYNDEYTKEQLEYIQLRKAGFKGLIEKIYNEKLNRRANFVPVTVAGPARYNYEKADKQTDMIMKRNFEYSEVIKKFIENTKKNLEKMTPIEKILEAYRTGSFEYGKAIETSDIYAIEKLEAKLVYFENLQKDMKEANKKARKDKKEQPYEPFKLTNNNKRIRDIKKRIEEVKEHKELRKLEGFNFNGGEVFVNYDIDRLQVFFDEKPNLELRTRLKKHGFVWSPREMAWQRQLTKNAMRVVKDMFPKVTI
ncbi:hypothetical protein [Clostridioides sp. ZZV15-6598]|uniref:hypothetical protein n=1 Tax=Clostridioides sp. ZZV15-6598 TaxID=2811501 RepID=UPI001D0F53B0|nr:hypothetical protein [Clostridioides sp. ZZV15-6598]